jgi:hypothetical protein
MNEYNCCFLTRRCLCPARDRDQCYDCHEPRWAEPAECRRRSLGLMS